MTKKELKYMEEYMLKETGIVQHDEYKYDQEEQMVFESIITNALEVFRKENTSKRMTISEYLNEENAKVKENIESPVSLYTLINRYNEQGFTAYLKTLDNDDLELAHHLIRREEITDDTDKMLRLIEMEESYRRYAPAIVELEGGKTI